MTTDRPDIDVRIRLRPVQLPDDESFLRMLYFDRRDDIRGLAIDTAMKEDLMLMQYRAHAEQYAADFPTAEHSIVILDDDSVGRYIVEPRPDVVHAIDISVLSKYRGMGIGTSVLGRTMREAAGSGRPVTLHVDFGNRAKGLYERLGFRTVGETQTNFEMEWTASRTEEI